MSDSGKISISIIDDLTNIPKHYTISATPADRLAEVDISPVPIPTLSFSDMQIAADEGATDAVVTVVASENPKQSLAIKYTLFDITSDIYLDKTAGTTTVVNPDESITKTESVKFTRPQGSNTWTANLPIPLRAKDNIDSFDGEIRILLDSPVANAGYTVTTTLARTTSITVEDQNIPVIRINQAYTTIYGYELQFQLFSDIKPKEPLPINYIPSNSSNAQWVNETEGAAGDYDLQYVNGEFVVNIIGGEVRTRLLKFERNLRGRYEARVGFLTQKDPGRDSGGAYLALIEDVHTPLKYKLSAFPQLRGVISRNPRPELFIKPGFFPIDPNTGEPLTTDRDFVTKTTFQEGEPIKFDIWTQSRQGKNNDPIVDNTPVKFRVTNMTGNFLDTSHGTSGAIREVNITWLPRQVVGSTGTWGNNIEIP